MDEEAQRVYLSSPPTERRPRQTQEERAEFVRKWFRWFFDHTDSFEPFALDLSYLWPAILNDESIEVDEDSELVVFLMTNGVEYDSEIFHYIRVDSEKRRRRSEAIA
jgi:hypothetical protein